MTATALRSPILDGYGDTPDDPFAEAHALADALDAHDTAETAAMLAGMPDPWDWDAADALARALAEPDYLPQEFRPADAFIIAGV